MSIRLYHSYSESNIVFLKPGRPGKGRDHPYNKYWSEQNYHNYSPKNQFGSSQLLGFFSRDEMNKWDDSCIYHVFLVEQNSLSKIFESSNR